MLPRKLFDRLRRYKKVSQSRIEPLETRRLLSAAVDAIEPNLLLSPDRSKNSNNSNSSGSQVIYYTPANGYTPSQIAAAYGFNQLTDNGAGTTIAIVDAYNDPDLSSDLKTFDSEYSLAAPPSFTQLSQTGGAGSSVQSNAGWALEESLDVEWAHAIAPGANIVLVEANSDSLSDLLTAVNFARNYANVSVVSMSWGSSEFYNETSYSSDFTTPSGHIGETFVASSGDSGSWSGPEWPASSANVLAVGGTSLYASGSSGAYAMEVGWSDSTGGLSAVVPEPAFQDSAQDTGSRTTPDVSYDADPNTGFAVYDSVSYEGYKGWQEIGGTSAGAPQWSALIAIADQEREADGLASLDGATQTLPTLYSIYATPGSADYSSYASTFHDVSTGSSSYFASATPGYDLVTGLGSPDVPAVVQLLVKGSVTATAPAPQKTPKIPRWTMYRFTTPAAVAPAASANTNVALAAIQSTIARPDFQVARVESAPAVATAAPSRSAVSITHTAGGSVWLETLGVYTADVAAITKVGQAVTIGVQNAATATVQLTDAAAAAAATAAPQQPHIWMQLATLDARVFADAMRAFAHESAAMESAIPTARWNRMMAASAAAIMADTILVGYWYWGRTRRRAKDDAAARSA
jgi:subtilase family serine protease